MLSVQRLVVLLLVGLVLGMGTAWHFSGAQEAKPAARVTKWEIRYLPEPRGDFPKGWKDAEKMADEGWELSGVERQSDGPLIYFFKRPKT